ncbi:hypothetical protein L4C36_16175 [Photobacterium japonica]|uniref:hypothetical protein n=1 Tax=Photobacterium japonica TaxID=2910235 RepID=UPI003D0E8E2B
MSLQPLHAAYLGELYGIAFFTAFAQEYSDDTHIYKWQLLIQVEQITAKRLKNYLDPRGIACSTHDMAMENKGRQDAQKWIDRDWPTLMDTLVPWVKPYALRYRQDAAQATDHHAMFDLVQQHEDAIYAFLLAEQQATHSGTPHLEAFIARYPEDEA